MMTTYTGSIKLDLSVYPGEEKGDAIRAFLEQLPAGIDVTAVATGRYHAGGNPEVEFTGPEADLAAVKAAYDQGM